MAVPEPRFAVVTGGSGGLGRAIAERLAQTGYRLILAVGSSRSLEDARAAWISRIGEALVSIHRVDLEDLDAVEAFGEGIAEVHPVLHALVNCAGRLDRGGIDATTGADLLGSYAVNCAAPVVLARTLVGSLRAGRGSIVNVASITAQIAGRNRIAYTASKAALIGVTRALALELAPTIRVNCILPGLFDTQMNEPLKANEDLHRATLSRIPQGRLGNPVELAGAVAFLVGDDSTYVTGTTLAVDGGVLARSPLPAGD